MCVFCKIVRGELPAYKLYEDSQTLAFLDINPVTLGHILVISKKHYANLEEVPAAELAQLILVVKQLGLRLKEKMGITGYNVGENNGSVAGQKVPHIHFHIIPRRSSDHLELWPRQSYKKGEAENILKIMTAEN